MNNILAKLSVLISANLAQFKRELANGQKDIANFTNSVKKVAGAVGVGFGIQQVSAFAIEVSRLSGEAEAVSAAFRRLPESTKLMSELKRATGGTVSELDLMKRAVQANNFEISLEALPRLLEFATLRAQQTGQSVDYLVDSIVTGIGRKSKLILDNLGISAVQLNEALGGASTAASTIGEVADAVGKIAEANLKNMEGFAENAATKMQRLSASWTDLKVAAGDAANSNGILGRSLNGITNAFNALSGDEFTKGLNQLLANRGRASEILERFAASGGKIDLSWQELLERGFIKTEAAAKKYEKILAQIAETQKNLALTKVEIDPATGLPTSGGKAWDPSMAEDHIISLNTLKEKEEELLAVFAGTDQADKKKLENRAAEILSIRAQIKAIEDLLKVEKEKKAKELKMVFTPDLEAEGSVNPELRNEQAKNEALEFANALTAVGTSAEFAGGAMIKLDQSVDATGLKMKEFMDLSGMVASGIANIASGFGAAASGAANFGEVILDSIGGFMQQFGASLIALGIGKISLEKFSGPAMIAAGFALTAAGAALSSSMSSKAGSVGQGGSGSSGSRGASTASRFRANTSVQDSNPQLVTVLKGEDLWIVLQNYQANNRLTRG